MNISSADSDYDALFEDACKINQSCNLNATQFWESWVRCMAGTAVCDIKCGEEISHPYLGLRSGGDVRYDAAITELGFR